jgi:hypothetical protein
LEEPAETLADAENIAREKAMGYARQYHEMPVLARDDTVVLVGVDEEDDPKNHNKEFVARKMGEYSDENGLKVFAGIAKKYGGEVPIIFSWGYALAWWEGGKLRCVSGLAQKRARLVEKASEVMISGYCFAAATVVEVDGVERYDSELSEEANMRAYAEQGRVIGELLGKMEKSKVKNKEREVEDEV